MAPDKDILTFADEVAKDDSTDQPLARPWKVLVADDEKEIHEITRIALGGYTFQGRELKLFSAYSGVDVKTILEKEDDIALILLDVVMERDDTGLTLVHYIRETLQNSITRIVLRTGQPGKAPEQEVITRYDINDYKAKTELTAQKLFTSVTASIRAYDSLKTIELNRLGLERIIHSTATIFESKSLYDFASGVLTQLLSILNIGKDSFSILSSIYAAANSQGEITVLAATGDYEGLKDRRVKEIFSPELLEQFQKLEKTGGDLFLEDDYIGVFKTKEGTRSLLHLNGCRFLSSSEKNLIRIYTTNVFIGFDNVSLAREIIDTQKEVIFTLGEIVETRSKETAHHVTRVAEFCHILASHCGLDEKTSERLKLASPMHDVGKIGIPESILHKPGKLTDEEFELIKAHAETGYYILKHSKRRIMQTAAIVAWQHHEKWDGTGYPQGLAGEDIHLYGRIAAVADVFDALTHKRCYKEAWSYDEVESLFKQESGRHFDPNLVAILLSNFDRFMEVNTQFPE